ncbi:MAG: alpha/beta fold hydrolase [Thiotrichaceae bacterium]
MKFSLYSFIFLFVFIQPFSYAATVVLIHGYLSDSSDWKTSKVTQPLKQAGWVYGGNYTNARTTQFGVITPPLASLKAKGKKYFTVDLPADAAIEVQARVLGFYLQHLYDQRKEPLVLVGHSAGGIVARAWLTMLNSAPNSADTPSIATKALVTIASPHLGTPLASLASFGSKTPLNEAARMFGIKNFRRSQAIFADLEEEKPGNYLYWLNHLQHPSIRYISVIRRNKKGLLKKFDYVVPRKSQDMNNISAISGQSAVYLTVGDHFLNESDGSYIRDLLSKIYQ